MYSYSGASIFCHHFLFFLCLCLFLSPFNEEVQIPCQEEEIHSKANDSRTKKKNIRDIKLSFLFVSGTPCFVSLL